MKLQDRISSFLNGAGFYIVLLLAVAMIGLSTFFIYRAVTSSIVGVEPPKQIPTVSESVIPSAPAVKPVEKSPDSESVPVSGTVPAAVKKPAKQTPKILWPLTGEIITPYSVDELYYSETMDDWRTHCGIDITAASGTPVVSACQGKVTSVIEDYWMGVTVTVLAEDGCELTYASLQKNPAVHAGDAVKPGDPIGTVGCTALLEEASGPHLHFSVSKNGDSIDPARYLPPSA